MRHAGGRLAVHGICYLAQCWKMDPARIGFFCIVVNRSLRVDSFHNIGRYCTVVSMYHIRYHGSVIGIRRTSVCLYGRLARGRASAWCRGLRRLHRGPSHTTQPSTRMWTLHELSCGSDGSADSSDQIHPTVHVVRARYSVETGRMRCVLANVWKPQEATCHRWAAQFRLRGCSGTTGGSAGHDGDDKPE